VKKTTERRGPTIQTKETPGKWAREGLFKLQGATDQSFMARRSYMANHHRLLCDVRYDRTWPACSVCCSCWQFCRRGLHSKRESSYRPISCYLFHLPFQVLREHKKSSPPWLPRFADRTHIKLRKTKPREWSREGASLLLAGPRIPKKCCFKKCGLMEARGPALDVLRLLPALKGPRVLSVGAAEAARAAKTAACG
jgi:hypothetical protein